MSDVTIYESQDKIRVLHWHVEPGDTKDAYLTAIHLCQHYSGVTDNRPWASIDLRGGLVAEGHEDALLAAVILDIY